MPTLAKTRTIVSLLMLFALSLLCLAPAVSRAEEPDRPELRAFWADGFNPAFKTPQEIDTLLQRLHDAHCNAIFAQMRKGGDAYYASHYEPWANDNPEHFDALACLIQKAHAMRPPIAVHAWINTCAVGGSRSPLAIARLHPDWLSLNPQGNNFDNEATKIDPGHLDAAEWTFRIYLDVVRHYPVDGIHFDFVRYGGKEWGYNPVSIARFRQRMMLEKRPFALLPETDLPAPEEPRWMQWRRDQVTGIVRKVYAHAMQVNPKVVVSAAVITWGDGPQTEEEWYTRSAAMNRVFQDWRGWLEEGILDLACPMTYFQADYHTDYQKHWSEFIKGHQYHRAATVAVGNWFNTIPKTFDLLKIAREPDKRGHLPYGAMLYSYGGTNLSETKDAKGNPTEETYNPEFYRALGQKSSYASVPPFPTDVPLPPMPWKESPRHGLLKGFVLTPDLTPVEGAKITISLAGRSLTQYTDGSGFYAFVDLPPGDYMVRVFSTGYALLRQQARVKAGQVTTASFTAGSMSIPLIRSFTPLLSAHTAPEGTPVRMEKLFTLIGTDTFPGTLYLRDETGVGMRVRLLNPPLLPFQSGDIVALAGTLATVEGERIIDRAVARLIDIHPESVQAPPLLSSGSQMRDSGNALYGKLVRVQGRVESVGADSFVINDGERITVLLRGRKAFGVEATDFGLKMPRAGESVSVTGIAVLAAGSAGAPPQILLHPRQAADVASIP